MQKPFIQLFRTPNNNYFFDANNSEFIEIDDDSYQYLSDVMSDNYEPGKSASITQELQILEAEGYLSSKSNVEEIKHPYTDYLDVFLDRKLSMLILQVTQDCNLRCSYCIYSESETSRQREHSRHRMNFDKAKRAIDFLLEHSVDSPKVNVSFYGGEPLLAFDLVRQAIEYSKKVFVGKELTFNLTSNGTLLNDEMIFFLEQHDVSLMISLDSPKEINDINRVFTNGKGTFDTIVERIQHIRKIAPEYAQRLQISMVIDSKNDYDCINEICLSGAELDRLTITPSLVEFEYEDKAVYASEEYIEKSEYQRFLAMLSHIGRYSDINLTPLDKRSIASIVDQLPVIDNAPRLYVKDAPSDPCIPGQFRLFVNVFGELLPCERVSELSPAMKIGTLYDGIDVEKAKQVLNIGYLTENECKVCWAFRHCSLCAKKADSGLKRLSGDILRSIATFGVASVYAQKRKKYCPLNESY